MPLSFLQLTLILLIVFTFTRVLLRMKEGTLEFGAFIFWVSVWLCALIIVIWPGTASRIATTIGVGRGADAVVYISLVVLFYLIFRTNVALENIRHELTELVRQLALNDEKIVSKKKHK